ncbi:hypothetical protein FRC12_011197, partial [Ceratobasidium sp. 428]
VLAIRQAVENLPPGARAAARAGATGAAVGIAVFAVPPILGFTTAGVAAGSVAAAIQSAVYGAAVPAGSLFATMQSVGATATVVPALVAATATAGGVAAVSGDGEEEPAVDEGTGEVKDDKIEESIPVEEPGQLVEEAKPEIKGTGGEELARPRNNPY